jgi:hypothetical protein
MLTAVRMRAPYVAAETPGRAMSAASRSTSDAVCEGVRDHEHDVPPCAATQPPGGGRPEEDRHGRITCPARHPPARHRAERAGGDTAERRVGDTADRRHDAPTGPGAAAGIRHRAAAVAGVVTGLLSTTFVVACPVSGHHAFGLWWIAQLGLVGGMLAVSLVALGRSAGNRQASPARR